MEITKLKEKYERKLKQIENDICEYEESNNNELIIASRTLKVEAKQLHIIVEALSKQAPIKVGIIEDDTEFICPTCGETTEEYDVKTLKFCPECGQKLDWE